MTTWSFPETGNPEKQLAWLISWGLTPTGQLVCSLIADGTIAATPEAKKVAEEMMKDRRKSVKIELVPEPSKTSRTESGSP